MSNMQSRAIEMMIRKTIPEKGRKPSLKPKRCLRPHALTARGYLPRDQLSTHHTVFFFFSGLPPMLISGSPFWTTLIRVTMASRTTLPRVSWSILRASCWGGRCSRGGSSALRAQKEEVMVSLILTRETLPMASQESGSTPHSDACQHSAATAHKLRHHTLFHPHPSLFYR